MARRHRDNPLAPELTGRLSDETMAQVAERRASIRLSPFATRDASAIRRDLTDRDRDTPLRPSFLRDVEKIMHMGAYNRSFPSAPTTTSAAAACMCSSWAASRVTSAAAWGSTRT